MTISKQIVRKNPKYVKKMRFEPFFSCLNDLGDILEKHIRIFNGREMLIENSITRVTRLFGFTRLA